MRIETADVLDSEQVSVEDVGMIRLTLTPVESSPIPWAEPFALSLDMSYEKAAEIAQALLETLEVIE